MKRLDAVHHRHHVIHADQVICLSLNQFQTFLAAGRHVDLHSGALQKSLCHRQVHGIVVHNQDSSHGRNKLFVVILDASQAVLVLLLKIAKRLSVHYLLHNFERKSGTLPVYALHLQPAAHHLNQTLCDGKSQPCPVVLAADCGVHPLKCLEELRNILVLDADSRILHNHVNLYGILRQLLPAQMQCNPALLRIAHSVRQEITDNLSDMYLVAKQFIGDILCDLQNQIQFFAAQLHRYAVDQVIQKAADIIDPLRQLHLIRLQFGEIQNIADQRQQNVARLPDISCVLLDRLLLTLPQNQFIQSQNRVDRRPQFMGHIRQENISGILRLLHRTSGRLQLHTLLL